ncbi:hypothetical protein RDI58_007671 [Solanum bulbocastanum]|uniref:YDG domain-containing protein n=1 Tax=Solanum bulbocastanum TaxID=147425 RepID=A0AAN8YME2_SOLBU
MYVPMNTSTSKKLWKKKLHQIIGTRSLSIFKRLRVDSINNSPENYLPSVRQNNGNNVQQHDVLINHKLNVPKIPAAYTRCEWFSNSGRIINESKVPTISKYEHIEKRKQVRETLKLFADEYTKLLREKKAEKQGRHSKRIINIKAAMILRNQEKWVNSEWGFGHAPGVEIGDQFRFKVELAMVGLHHKIFRGQGGNPRVSVNAIVEDQKIERDNLALKNSIDLGYSVRVIYGRPRVNDEKTDGKYIYYGLYTVTKCWQERGLKIAVAQVNAQLLSSDVVLLRTEVSFHSTQEALFLKQSLLFMSVVHIANVLHLAKIGLANMVFGTILWYSKPNRKDGV